MHRYTFERQERMSKQTNASTSPVSVLPLSTNVVSVRGKTQQIKESKTWKGKQRQAEQQEVHDIDDVCVSGQTALKKLKSQRQTKTG